MVRVRYTWREPMEIIKQVINSYVDRTKYKVFLFGSRAKWDFRNTSDYDIGIIWSEKLDYKKLSLLRGQLYEIPYKVDIIDFYSVRPEFKKLAMKQIVEI